MPHSRRPGSMLHRVRTKHESKASQSAHHRAPQLVVRSAHHGHETLPVAMGGTAIERSMVNVGSIAVYHVRPVVALDAKHDAKATVFAVHVQNAITGRSWVVHRRFSDFLVLRGLITEHFKLFYADFPRLASRVNELYFPKKHTFRHNVDKIVEHRCDAFLEFLMGLHRLLVCHTYIVHRDISPIGLSILRGFLGSAIVQDPSHKAYAFHRPILPIELKPSERTPIHQCGSLTTVLEDDAEYELEAGHKAELDSETDSMSRDGSTEESLSSSLSEDTSDGDDVEMTARMRELVNRRRAHKYARNRRVLHFLRKDVLTTDTWWEANVGVEHDEHEPECAPPPGDYAHIEKMYVRATDMALPSAMMRIMEAPKPISA
ncbi:unnamed protein product [Hyaloperonospora brassicae]|uniref:PX domain-containing protein n=1 Tax=Hyaloperonospora brassicae TaxID=162125 RepID=A0AAV0UIW9_HYABA|nr:unnamed protein product [Hyaloperonospora brassicae]